MSNLMQEIDAVINTYADNIATQVMTEWMRIGYQPQISGEAEVKTAVKRVTKDTILFVISGKGQRALLMEYGKGSLLDRSNPYLSEYIQWEGFNYDRLLQGFAILGRPKGKYKDLDNKTHFSGGNLAGKNLEEILGSKNPKYQPFPAFHVIRNAVCGEDGNGGMLNAILNDIADVISFYNFFKDMPSEICL